MHAYYFITCTTIKSSQPLLLLHHILLHHMHCSHFITCPAITSSHTLLLLHHIHCSYFITGHVSTSSHALLLLQHMHCSHFITGTAISPYALLSLFHMHCAARGNRTHDHRPWFFLRHKQKKKKGLQCTHLVLVVISLF